MMMRLRTAAYGLLLFLLPACAGVEQEASAPPASVPSGETLLDLSLTDARSGETFTLASYAGRTVLIEPMATW